MVANTSVMTHLLSTATPRTADAAGDATDAAPDEFMQAMSSVLGETAAVAGTTTVLHAAAKKSATDVVVPDATGQAVIDAPPALIPAWFIGSIPSEAMRPFVAQATPAVPQVMVESTLRQPTITVGPTVVTAELNPTAPVALPPTAVPVAQDHAMAAAATTTTLQSTPQAQVQYSAAQVLSEVPANVKPARVDNAQTVLGAGMDAVAEVAVVNPDSAIDTTVLQAGEQLPVATTAKLKDFIHDLAPERKPVADTSTAVVAPRAPTDSVTTTTATATAHTDGAAQQQLNHPVGSAPWRDELGAKLTWLIDNKTHSATLKLTPEHLGPLEVQINVSNKDNTSIWFTAAHADTRTALEQALPRLRELLESQGMSLTDAGVFKEPPRDQGRAPTQLPHSFIADEPVALNTSQPRVTSSGRLDAYA